MEGSKLAVRLPAQPDDIRASDLQTSVDEIRGRESREFHRAFLALSELSGPELELVAEIACLARAETPARRSWRGRFLRAAAELAEIDSDLLLPALMLARQRRARFDGAAADPTRGQPLTPFIVEWQAK